MPEKMRNDALVDGEILRARANADELYSSKDVSSAVDKMADAISKSLRDTNPLVLVVMNGGMIPASMILTRLNFPLELGYIHLTRYGDKTSGGDIHWLQSPPSHTAGRTVLLVDDLLDHGITLAAALEQCREAGAKNVFTAVLIVKRILSRPGLQQTDFHALETPDRYLFGMGMDYKGYWRNLDGIFALGDPA